MNERRKRTAVGVCFAAVFLGTLVCALGFGSVALSPARLLAALAGTDHTARVILLQMRLPRVLGAALAGAGLAVAGLLLQTVTGNELCAPNVIGVNAGAGFAVMLTLCCAPLLWRLLPLTAFVGALLTTALVVALSGLGGRYGQKSTVVLAGVAISTLFSAGISFLSLGHPDALASYSAFSVGGFSGLSLRQLPVPAAMIFLGFAAAMLLAPKISLLCLGDEAAETLGVRVRRLRAVTVVLCSALCAAVVSYAGLLGFVGLMTPHIIRRLVDGSLRRRLPYTAVGGGTLVLLADLLGRTLLAPGETPAGILLAAVGAPFFLFLLLRRRRHGREASPC